MMEARINSLGFGGVQIRDHHQGDKLLKFILPPMTVMASLMVVNGIEHA